MGAYDYVENIQVKFTPDCDFRHYELGDKIPVQDGAYLVTGGGVILVRGGRVALVERTLFDKWGGMIDPMHLLEERNPVYQVVKSILKEKELAHVLETPLPPAQPLEEDEDEEILDDEDNDDLDEDDEEEDEPKPRDE